MDEERFIKYIKEEERPLMGGRAEETGTTENDVDPKQLKMGIKVEMEHTTDPLISKEIALDHLAEHNNSDYYTRLAKMEKEMDEELGKRNSNEG